VVTVSGPQQVNLKVTVAEVQRSAVRQLGLDLAGALTIGQLTTGIVNYSSLGAASGVVSGTGQAISSPGLPTGVPVATGNSIAAGFSIPGLSLAATLHALEQRNLLRTLDEPTLTAMSGQPAELDAGGQIPLLNPPDQNGQISYTYKQIGVKLTFTPTVKSNGMINLVVDSSVTDVNNTFSVSVAGVSVPGLDTREAKTTVELPAGSTLSIGGLFEDQMRQQISSLPGIGNIPILGALFRSRDFIHDQTELVILVTPYLASPGAAPPLPTDGVVAAGDAEATFLGRMQKLYGVGDPRRHGGAYQGSVGFSLE
jgi:pilus assembly protein CpaC